MFEILIIQTLIYEENFFDEDGPHNCLFPFKKAIYLWIWSLSNIKRIQSVHDWASDVKYLLISKNKKIKALSIQ